MSQRKTELLFLNKADVESIITYEDVVVAVRKAFEADGNGQMIVPSKDVMMIGEEAKKNFIFAMPAYLGNIGVAGVKWTNFYPFQKEDIPPIWAHILVLSQGENGQPYAIMDATTITNMRTSGGHAVVAAQALAKKSSKTLSILGCGAQGCAALQSFDKHFELETIKIYDIKPEVMENVQKKFQPQTRAKIVPVASPQNLTQGCDILLSATTCRQPLIKTSWIEKGCFVDAMFAFNDLEPNLTSAADKWVLGHRESDRIEILEHRNFGHLLNAKDVYASLGEILTGKKPGRESDDEIIVYSHMGMGSLDISVGNRLYEIAREKGIGQKLQLT